MLKGSGEAQVPLGHVDVGIPRGPMAGLTPIGVGLRPWSLDYVVLWAPVGTEPSAMDTVEALFLDLIGNATHEEGFR